MVTYGIQLRAVFELVVFFLDVGCLSSEQLVLLVQNNDNTHSNNCIELDV